MAERLVSFRVGERRLTLRGAHDSYLDPIEGADLAADPLARLAQTLPPAPAILDVGANIGLTALILAAIRPAARIAAFEPIAQNASLLERNLRENNLADRCTVVRAAVGEAPGTTTMIADGPWSLVAAAGPAVPVITLDSWCAANLPETRIDLIKIDVEGYEPNVLAGAAALIRRWRPPVFLEFNSWTLLLQGRNPLAFAAFLWEAFAVTGANGETFPDAREFVFQNLMERRCVDDLVLRPRPEAALAPERLAATGFSPAPAPAPEPKPARPRRLRHFWRRVSFATRTPPESP